MENDRGTKTTLNSWEQDKEISYKLCKEICISKSKALTRSDILQGQAPFRGVEQLLIREKTKQKNRKIEKKKNRKKRKKEKQKKRKREKEKKRKREKDRRKKSKRNKR